MFFANARLLCPRAIDQCQRRIQPPHLQHGACVPLLLCVPPARAIADLHFACLLQCSFVIWSLDLCFQLVSTRTNKWLLPAARSNAFAVLLFVARAILHGHIHSCPKCSPLAVNFVFAASLNTQNINSEFYRIRWDEPSVALTVPCKPTLRCFNRNACFFGQLQADCNCATFSAAATVVQCLPARCVAAAGPNRLVVQHTAASLTVTVQYYIYHKKRFLFCR